MKKHVIAVDCDDVIVESTPIMIQIYNETYGTTLSLADMYTDNLVAWGVEDDDEAIQRVNAIMQQHASALNPMKQAIEALQVLSRDHELHLVTGRADFLQEATRAWLERHLSSLFMTVEFTNYIVPSDSVHITRTKLEVCRSIGADVLIDDHLHHAVQVAGGGVKVLLFGDYPWNATSEGLSSSIVRVKDWNEVVRFFDRRR